MTSNKEHQARNFFQRGFHALGEYERRAVDKILRRYSRGEPAPKELTFGERLADRVASFGGSWTFIMLFAGFLIAWVVLNSIMLPMMLSDKEGFDPYPYILLNLFLSMLAAIQAPIIMMSQNRQSEHDRQSAQEDFEINLKAEMEILSLHEKMDDLRDEKLQQLIESQQEQIEMLTTILKKHLRQNHQEDPES